MTLKTIRKMTPQEAVIMELNLLIEFARSAASTEAGTAFTKKTLAALKTKAEEFSSEISRAETSDRCRPG